MKDDVISKQAAIDAIVKHSYAVRYDYNFTSIENGMTVTGIKQVLGELPSAQPEIIRCKDCKHWKDSDGIYRRGFNAESKCPLNNKSVYEGTFYCGFGERKEDRHE